MIIFYWLVLKYVNDNKIIYKYICGLKLHCFTLHHFNKQTN